MQALRQQGIQFIQPSPAAIAEIKALIGPANANLIRAGNLTPARVAVLEQYLAQYRAANANGK